MARYTILMVFRISDISIISAYMMDFNMKRPTTRFGSRLFLKYSVLIALLVFKLIQGGQFSSSFKPVE